MSKEPASPWVRRELASLIIRLQFAVKERFLEQQISRSDEWIVSV